MKISKIIKYQLYLLQLENYELGRYFKLLFKKGLWPSGEQRKKLVWTWKAQLIFIVAIVLHFGLPVLLYFYLSEWFFVFSIKYFVFCILVFIILDTIYPILYTISLALLWPFDWLAKRVVIIRAKLKIKNLESLKIIGIAGSFGKTTMKEVLKQVLGVRFQVLATPESVNTPVGIARWVLKNLTPFPNPSRQGRGTDNFLPLVGRDGEGVEIAIIEMGEHYQGDVEYLCKITPLDIAVVTGINEAHLERMKTLDNITSTIFEIISHAKPGAMVVLNGDDENVVAHYKEYIWPDHQLEFYSKNSSSKKCKVKSAKFDTERLGWEIEIPPLNSPPILGGENGGVKVFINLLGEYALSDVDAAIKIGRELGMTDEEIKKGLVNIRPLEHRLQPIKTPGNILVIDDSYNGNSDGAAEAIAVLSRFANCRKIYITPGLVEMGEKSADIHHTIGRHLAKVADIVILIKNSVTPWIEEGIKSENRKIGKSDNRIIWFSTAQEAHLSLGKILQPDDVVLFQNDWGDQYI